MQNHRPENNESMNGKVSLSFNLGAAQRRQWILQQAAAELPYCSEDRALLKRCSRIQPNPRTNPNFPYGLRFQKTICTTHQRALGRRRHVWVRRQRGRHLARPVAAGGIEHPPKHASKADLDLQKSL